MRSPRANILARSLASLATEAAYWSRTSVSIARAVRRLFLAVMARRLERFTSIWHTIRR